MIIKKKYLLYITIPVVYITLFYFSEEYQIRLTEEDGFFENLSAIAYLFASILFFCIFLKYNDEPYTFFGKAVKRNIYFALLGVLFFLIVAEEINWGQRIFKWNTPKLFMELNAQKETNIHNLWLFQAYKPDGTQKSFLENMLNFNRLLNIFWMMFCVIIPIISLVSKKGKKSQLIWAFPSCHYGLVDFLF